MPWLKKPQEKPEIVELLQKKEPGEAEMLDLQQKGLVHLVTEELQQKEQLESGMEKMDAVDEAADLLVFPLLLATVQHKNIKYPC